jgi:polyhydroxyalkanoate synthesis regulator phasin
VAERLTFTLAGRDELSRVMNGTADSADRLRLRLAGITADADGNLRDLRGQFLSLADAQSRVDDHSAIVQRSMSTLSDASDKLGESLKANLISLLPAAIPAAAGMASSAAALAGQLGAVTVAAGAYALALGPQISAIGEAADAQQKYDDAVEQYGATSQQAVKAQAEYQRQLEKLPPATREAAIAVGLLKDNYQEWSDSLSDDVMAPFTKGVAVANELLPKTTGLVRGASSQFDRLITLVGGGISTPGFDALNDRFTRFTNDTLDNGIDRLTIFLAKLQSGEYDNGQLREWFDYAQQAGPVVWDTLENVAEALLNVLEAGSGVGVGMLEVINVLSGIVSAVPPDAIATLLQLAIAIKAVKLAAAGGAAAGAAVAALGVQIGAMRAAAAAAPGALAGTTAAIGTLSRTAKLAMAGTGIGLLLIGLDYLASKSEKPKVDVDKLSASIIELGRSGKLGGEGLRAYGKDLGGLADSLQKVVDPEGLDQVQQSIISFFGTDSTPIKAAKEDIDALDQALAGLVSNGQADLAAAGLDRIIANLERQGFTSEQVRGQLDAYRDALAGQRLEQELAAQSMGLFGAQAQQVQAKLDAQKSSADGLRQSIVALNDANRQGLSGMIGFEAAIDAASKAAAENAGVLDMHGGKLTLNTEKQRAAATSLNDLAAKTDEATAAARESGASWQEVNGIYERGRQQLIKNAMQMGLNRQEAKALADQILKTPDKTAKLRGNLEDLQAKLETAKARLKSVPDSRKAKVRADIYQLEQQIAKARRELDAINGKTSHTYVITHLQARREGSHGTELGYAQGGPIVGRGGLPGYPGGGLLQGPGTPTSDSILLWGSTGEYMVRAASVAKYGLDFMHALNAGRLPVGRAAAPGRPAAPGTSAPSTAPEQRVTYNVYPRQSVISVEDLRLLQRQEEARQRVGRPR